MSLRIYNTLSRKKEPFHPLQKKKVKMYVCGPTVYHHIHVGNARPMVFFDFVYRYLTHKGYEITFVRNITDIDDKIIARAQEEKRDASEVAMTYTAAFEKVMQALAVSPPDHEPKATEHIPEMIEWIKGLIEKGAAYQAGGEVLFSIEKFKSYGKLSKKKTDDLIAGVRVEVSEHKRNPIDFVLWKPAKPGEPSRESPWGAGRPGWHLECSVMSTKYLGESFDIHGGGSDLIFPHHENEIAQSESYTGKPFVRYWMHNGLLVLGREKMSKSLGNIVTVSDFLKKNPPEVLRFILLSNHYRSPLEFSDQVTRKGILALEKIYKAKLELQKRFHHEIRESKKKRGFRQKEDADFHKAARGFWKKFERALDDDFNTAKAFGYLFDLVRSLNRFLNQEREWSKKDKTAAHECMEIFKKIGSIFGFLEQDPEKFLESLKQKLSSHLPQAPQFGEAPLSVQEIEKWIELRKEARERKDWKKADEIRSHLLKYHVVLEDTPAGTTWKIET
jgi:cysteinyl-tRNA synthetase